jgi:hypothetical protein
MIALQELPESALADADSVAPLRLMASGDARMLLSDPSRPSVIAVELLGKPVA